MNTELMNTVELSDNIADTRVAIQSTANAMIEAVQSGEVSALEMKLKQKFIEAVIEQTKPVIDKAAREEAELYGEKKFNKFGGEVSLIEAGQKFDYTLCNYQKYFDAVANLEKAKEAVKECETFLKSIKGSMNIVTEDGEAVTVFPPIKTSTSTLKITF